MEKCPPQHLDKTSKESLRVTLDHGRRLYLSFFMIANWNPLLKKIYAKLFEWIEHTVAIKRCISKQNQSDTYALKSLHLRKVCSWLCCRISSWCKSQPGFDASYEHLTCLTTLRNCDTTKQSVCTWLYIYIYIYIYVYITHLFFLFSKFILVWHEAMWLNLLSKMIVLHQIFQLGRDYHHLKSLLLSWTQTPTKYKRKKRNPLSHKSNYSLIFTNCCFVHY